MSQPNPEIPQNLPPQNEPNGSAPEPWYNVLPEHLRAEQSVTRYPDLGKFAEAKLHLEKHFGVPEDQLLRMPANDDVEGMAKIYNRLGRPETFDKYELPAIEGFPKLAPEVETRIKEEFHKAGLNQSQVEKLMQLEASIGLEQAKATQEAEAAELAASELKLKSVWGREYETTLAQVQEFMVKEFDDETLDRLEKTGLDKDPSLIMVLGNVLRKYETGGALPGTGPGNGLRSRPGGMTPIEAQAAINAKTADLDFQKALTDRSHIGHDQAVKLWGDLNRAAAQRS